MKKLLLVIVASVFCATLYAQPWLDGIEKKNGRIKLQDVVDAQSARNNYLTPETNTTKEETEYEGYDYHYQRWLWYWEGRTDADGYLVSPAKQWYELKKLQQSRAQAKGTLSKDVNWSFQGPTNPLGENKGIGRINAVEFHPTDTNTLIIGSAGGGVWRTTDNGLSWQVLNDFLPVLGVSDVDYNPQNPNTIYVCTGDRDANDTYSMGVFRSVDGGTTWDTTGFQYSFTQLEKTNGLLVNWVDTNSLTLATSGGIYKSYDAGKTWNMTYGGSFQQILYHPTDTAIMYTAGLKGSIQVHRSIDGGATWQQTSNFSGAIRCVIAVTKADPSIVKAITSNQQYGLEGIYSSNDTGKSFTKIFDDDTCKKNILASSSKGNRCGGQGWYDLTIQISPLNANHLVAGGVNTWYSTNGGNSWKVANQWKNTVTGVTLVHADKHMHMFHPLKPGTLYECNDGGIFFTESPMSSNGIWNDLTEGLGITQFYRNAVAPSAMYVLGGSQDNGTKMITGGTSKHMTGADGMDCQIDPIDSNVLYTSQQYGELRRSTNGGDNFTDIQNNIPNKPKGAWITPIVISPSNNQTIFTGYRQVFHSPNRGDNWYPMSDSVYDNIDRIAVTPLNHNYMYFSVNNIIQYTTNFGNDWKNIINNNTGSVSDIMVHPENPNRLWVTFRSYNGDKVSMYDIDSGRWYKHTKNLPAVPANCIEYDHTNKTYYIGTDLGVFYREKESDDWLEFNNGTLPNVEVIDLGINSTTNQIWAATYGRGMWKSPTHKSTVGVATLIPYRNDVITIAPNPNKGIFNIHTDNDLLKGSVVNAQILNITGAVVWNKNLTISNAGNTSITADLPKGTYIVQLIDNGTVFTKTKMIVY